MNTLFESTQALNGAQVALESLFNVQQGLKRGEWNLGIALESDQLCVGKRVATNAYYQRTESEGVAIALENIAAKVWEFIRNLLKKLAEYIKRFFAWISGSNSEERHVMVAKDVDRVVKAVAEAVHDGKKELAELVEAENISFLHGLAKEQLRMMDHQTVATVFETYGEAKLHDYLTKYKSKLKGFSEQVKKLHMYALDADVHRTDPISYSFLTDLNEEVKKDKASLDQVFNEAKDVPEAPIEVSESTARHFTPEVLAKQARFLVDQAEVVFGDHRSEAEFKSWLEPLGHEFDKAASMMEDWQREANMQPVPYARHNRDDFFHLLGETIREVSAFIGKMTQMARLGFQLGSSADHTAYAIAKHLTSLLKKAGAHPDINDTAAHGSLGWKELSARQSVRSGSMRRDGPASTDEE
jgi:uncharacterized protein YoxC